MAVTPCDGEGSLEEGRDFCFVHAKSREKGGAKRVEPPPAEAEVRRVKSTRATVLEDRVVAGACWPVSVDHGFKSDRNSECKSVPNCNGVEIEHSQCSPTSFGRLFS